MIKELDSVVLTNDISEYELVKGDVGTVVHCYAGGNAYEVEFVTVKGEKIGVLTLPRDLIRPFFEDEILHTRQILLHYDVADFEQDLKTLKES